MRKWRVSAAVQTCIILSAVLCSVGRPAVIVQEEHTPSSPSTRLSTTQASSNQTTPIHRAFKKLGNDNSPMSTVLLDSHTAIVKVIASSVFGGLVVVTIAVALFIAATGKRRHESKSDLPACPHNPQADDGNEEEASVESVPNATPAHTPRNAESQPNLAPQGHSPASINNSNKIEDQSSTQSVWKNAETAYSVSLPSHTFGACSDTVDDSLYSATLHNDKSDDNGDEQNRYGYKKRQRTNSFMEPGSIDLSTQASQNEQS